jgi:hypothetical protein
MILSATVLLQVAGGPRYTSTGTGTVWTGCNVQYRRFSDIVDSISEIPRGTHSPYHSLRCSR